MNVGDWVYIKWGVKRLSNKTRKITLSGGDRVKIVGWQKDGVIVEKGTKRFILKEDEVCREL